MWGLLEMSSRTSPASGNGEESHWHRLACGDKEIILLGVAPFSKDNAVLVEQAIAVEKPDTVCLELCKLRFEALQHKEEWQGMDILKVIREKRTALLLTQLLLSTWERKLSLKFPVHCGDYTVRAIKKAEEIQAQIVLIDRELRTSLLRLWRNLGFIQKMKVAPAMLLSLFFTEDVSEDDVEGLKQRGVLELAMRSAVKAAPESKSILVDEREQYMAHAIAGAPGRKILAVMGTGHLSGVMENIGHKIDIEPLLEIPTAGPWAGIAVWLAPFVIFGFFVSGFFLSGTRPNMDMLLGWSAVTAAFSGLGALLMLAHPLTIILSAFTAPLTTLYPLVAAGWVAGLTEVSVRRPKVLDFLEFANDISSIRGLFSNRITRVFVMFIVVNLTTSIGTFITMPEIMRFF